MITLIAVLLSDIGNVVGVSGALLGAVSFLIIFSPFVFCVARSSINFNFALLQSIVYIFPTLIYSKVKRKTLLSPVNLLIPLGATLALLGVWQTLK